MWTVLGKKSSPTRQTEKKLVASIVKSRRHTYPAVTEKEEPMQLFEKHNIQCSCRGLVLFRRYHLLWFSRGRNSQRSWSVLLLQAASGELSTRFKVRPRETDSRTEGKVNIEDLTRRKKNGTASEFRSRYEWEEQFKQHSMRYSHNGNVPSNIHDDLEWPNLSISVCIRLSVSNTWTKLNDPMISYG